MFVRKLHLVLFFMINFYVSNCNRRIGGGQLVRSDKSYVVYLVKASMSSASYDFWLCGGALVTTDFIITSAACVEDVNYLYAIAGYRKYITDDQIEKNDCTRNYKKKVIFTCVPVSYSFDYDQIDRWSYIDIALAKVESPYELNDVSYLKYCSYSPTIIPINYDPKYQLPEIDAMVFGWGHRELWRKRTDSENYNQELLYYTPTLIMDKNECKQHYTDYPNMSYVIDQFMICTLYEGTINENGGPISPTQPTVKGCDGKQKLSGLTDSCEEEENKGIELLEDTRRNYNKSNKTHYNYTMHDFIRKAAGSDKTVISNKTRRNGICQNDHGGPLVTWVGSREVIIGVASVFKITEDNKCIGPFLYTSTQCNGAFLDCVLNVAETTENPNRRNLCDSPPSVKGFDLVENHISWKDHPAGPAANEMYGPNKRYTPNENKYQAKETYLEHGRNEKVNDGLRLMRPQRPLYRGKP